VNWSAIATVLSMSIVVERLLEAFGEPVVKMIGKVRPDVKRIVYLLLGSALGWALGLNAFPAFVRYPIVGDIMTALLLGAGSQVIHAIIGSLQAKENVITLPAPECTEGLEDIARASRGRLG
jgi:hypothetical protein